MVYVSVARKKRLAGIGWPARRLFIYTVKRWEASVVYLLLIFSLFSPSMASKYLQPSSLPKKNGFVFLMSAILSRSRRQDLTSTGGLSFPTFGRRRVATSKRAAIPGEFLYAFSPSSSTQALAKTGFLPKNKVPSFRPLQLCYQDFSLLFIWDDSS